MMNSELKAKWVADLRANPDLQGKLYLRHKGLFCCLGRLYEVDVSSAKSLEEVMSNSNGYATFPSSIQLSKWGIDKFYAAELAKMNDEWDYTFSQIADAIEQNPNI